MNEMVRQFYKEYQNAESETCWVGKDYGGGVSVSFIKYHEPQGEGDSHYVTILLSDGNFRRVFKPDNIES